MNKKLIKRPRHSHKVKEELSPRADISKKDIKTKCVELAIQYMDHRKYPSDECTATHIVDIAKIFESYITSEENESCINQQSNLIDKYY